jgi:RNA polymerase sigma-70 factor (ECF subfamily)
MTNFSARGPHETPLTFLTNQPNNMHNTITNQAVTEITPIMRGIVVPILRNEEMVQDAIQQAFLQAFKSKATFEGRSQLKTWLCCIARNVALTMLKKQAHTTDLEDIPEVASKECVVQECLNSELGEAIERAMTNIPKKLVEPFVRMHRGESTKEVSHALGIPEGTVRQRAYQAREMLKVALAGYR